MQLTIDGGTFLVEVRLPPRTRRAATARPARQR